MAGDERRVINQELDGFGCDIIAHAFEQGLVDDALAIILHQIADYLPAIVPAREHRICAYFRAEFVC